MCIYLKDYLRILKKNYLCIFKETKQENILHIVLVVFERINYFVKLYIG